LFNIFKKIQTSPLSLKIAAIALICLIIPFTGVSAISYRMLERRINQRTLNEAEYAFTQMSASFSDVVNDITRNASLVIVNPSVREFLGSDFEPSADNYGKYRQMIGYIQQLAINNSLISSCSVYAVNETLPESWGTLFSMSRLPEAFVLKNDFEYSSAGWYFGENVILEGMKNYSVSFYNDDEFVYIIPINSAIGEYLGFLKIGIDKERFFDSAVRVSTNVSLAVTDGEKIIYNSNDSSLNALEVLGSPEEDGKIFTLNRSAAKRLKITDMKLTVCMIYDISSNASELLEMRLNILLTAIILMSVTAGLLILIINLLMRRIKRVTKRMSKVAMGDFTPLENIGPMDEAGQITAAFNSMAFNISQLEDRIRASEEVRKEAELATLRAQINPHFIYNVLEIFKSRLKEANEPEIAEAMITIGKMLRYSTNWKKESRLSDEISHLRSYIQIQNVMLPGRIQCFIECKEGISDAVLPKMTLLPIVENCIVHGLGKEKPLNIIVKAEKIDKNLIITVFDDGLGIDLSEVEQINKRLQSPDDTSSGKGKVLKISNIGLNNINQRIKMSCGEEYGISIRSQKNLFTEVTLRMIFTSEQQ